MPVVTEYATGTPCWVDVTTPDLGRTISFYTDLFGWETEGPQEEAGNYTMFTKHGKSVAAASPPMPGSEGIPPHWTTYIASDDVDETTARIKVAGGTVLMDPFDVFDSGRMAIAQDPGGATFGVWQAREHVGAQIVNEPGSLSWNENQTRDPETAARFYSDVFGYEVEAADMGEGAPYRVLKIDGRGVAGMFELTPDMAQVPPNWATTFAVEDTDAAAKRVEELGGTVLVQPFDIPTVGRYAVVKDPVGVVFGIMAG
jgi:predicted enzyme related to lactoylglutathione lyase